VPGQVEPDVTAPAHGTDQQLLSPTTAQMDAEAVKLNPAALHNTKEKLNQRQQMLDGEQPAGCSYCWNMEKTGEMSDRHYRSGEPWAMQDFDDIRKNP
jgi:hypothetical protein